MGLATILILTTTQDAHKNLGFFGRMFGGSADDEIAQEFEALAKLVSKHVQATEVMRDSFTDGHVTQVDRSEHCTLLVPRPGDPNVGIEAPPPAPPVRTRTR